MRRSECQANIKQSPIKTKKCMANVIDLLSFFKEDPSL